MNRKSHTTSVSYASQPDSILIRLRVLLYAIAATIKYFITAKNIQIDPPTGQFSVNVAANSEFQNSLCGPKFLKG